MKLLLVSPPSGEKGKMSKGLPVEQRMAQISLKGFPMSHITSWMVQYPQGRAFKEYARERARKKQEGLTG